MLKADQIRGYPLFKDLSAAELDALAGCMDRRFFSKDAYLFRPGNPAINLYLVETGMVRVFFYGNQGKEFLLMLGEPGGVIGMPVAQENRFRLLGAAVQLPSTLLSLPYDDLFRIARASKQLLLNMYSAAAASVGGLLTHYQSMVTSGLEERIAAFFLRLGEANDGEVHIPVSQADLASWLGASRGRMNLTLVKFQKRGLIRLEGMKLFILDREGLARLAEGAVLEDL